MRLVSVFAFALVLSIPAAASAQSDGGVAAFDAASVPAVVATGSATLVAPDATAPARPPEGRERDEGSATAESAPTAAQLQARIHYDRSRAHYAAGHYRAAVRELEAAVSIDPEGANLWYNLGNVSERLGDIDRARVAYRRYLDRTRDAVEQERTRRILTRLDGARAELASLRQRPMGRADAAFWTVTGAAIGATGLGAAWLLSSRQGEPTLAPWAITAGGLSLGVLATVLYFAREAPRAPAVLVGLSPTGAVDITGRF